MDEEGTSSSQPHESNITSQLRASSYPDDEPIAHNLLCCEDTEMSIDPIDIQCAWRCELEVPRHISPKEMETWSPDGILLAINNARKSSYQLSSLSPSEQKAFQQAKETEVNNWLKTGTVSTILRHKLVPEQINRSCVADGYWFGSLLRAKVKRTRADQSSLPTSRKHGW